MIPAEWCIEGTCQCSNLGARSEMRLSGRVLHAKVGIPSVFFWQKKKGGGDFFNETARPCQARKESTGITFNESREVVEDHQVFRIRS